jgi:hypothetical protein
MAPSSTCSLTSGCFSNNKLSISQSAIPIAYCTGDNPNVSTELTSAQCSSSSWISVQLLQLTATCSGVHPPRSFSVMDSFFCSNFSTWIKLKFSTASWNYHLTHFILYTILLTTGNSDSDKWDFMNFWQFW